MDDQAYYDGLIELLEGPYLAADDVRAQSGFRGDAARWELARRPIATPMRHNGDFLDIGCANGHLMETIAAWAAEDGIAIEPYGLDLSPRLAALARERLPQWSGRIWDGNAMTWQPPRRFDYVRTELGYVPEHSRRLFVQRLIDTYLVPGGLAILCSYGSSRRPAPLVYDVASVVSNWGFSVAGEANAVDHNGIEITKVCWVAAPTAPAP